MYIHLNKETKKITPFGSIEVLSKVTGIKKDNLYTHFGRKGNTEFENDSYRIVKAAVIRSSKPTE